MGFYSGAARLLEVFQKEETSLYPGISTVAYLCAKVKTAWEDARLLSLHGRSQNLIGAVRAGRKVFALAGGRDGVKEICEKLLEYGLSQVEITVGERLSYPQERIVSGTPEELLTQSWDGLCALLIRNGKAEATGVHGLEDEAFLRGDAPMTKAEVRSVSLSRLRLKRDSIAYDVGAGTGSVAVEMAMQAWDGQVYAIERDFRGRAGEKPKGSDRHQCHCPGDGGGGHGLPKETAPRGRPGVRPVCIQIQRIGKISHDDGAKSCVYHLL